jgi:four helix bundle protein
MQVFAISRSFPSEERFGLTDQIRRSSRGVCSNLAEAWRKRRYERAFASKIADAEAEAAETQVWLEFAVECGYMSREHASDLCINDNEILGTLVGMRTHAKSWTLNKKR